jgi:hypothetical protein
MNASGIFGATQILVEILEDMGVSYFIGGSVASSVHGLPRSTLDVDLVADLSLDHVQPLVECSQATFYIDDEMVEDAVKREASFNVIHLETMTKLDVLGVLKVQAETLDMIYMKQWAKELQVDTLLQRALAETDLAGL